MNSEEGMSMAKMAVTVLLVILVIGAVVGIVYMAYSWFNSGTDKLSDTVTSIDKSSFSNYDDAQVTGAEVLSALRNYRESDICIAIRNTNGKQGYDASNPPISNCPVYIALPSSIHTDNNTNIVTSEIKYEEVNKAIGKAYCIEGFSYAADNISVQKNTNFSPTTTTSSVDTYVKQSAKWYANLIYNKATGEIAGILFRQMS